jgi:hypothetical protein
MLRRPRARANNEEMPLPTFHLMASENPLNRRVVEQTLVGVAMRQHARSLEEILTVLTLGIAETLRRSLATTNGAESLTSRTPARETKCEALARRTDGASPGRAGALEA